MVACSHLFYDLKIAIQRILVLKTVTVGNVLTECFIFVFQVTMLTGHEVSSPRKNIIALTHGLKYAHTEHINMFELGRNNFEFVKLFSRTLADMSRDLYQTPVVSELYRRKDEFDVVIIDFFWNEVSHYHYQRPKNIILCRHNLICLRIPLTRGILKSWVSYKYRFLVSK